MLCRLFASFATNRAAQRQVEVSRGSLLKRLSIQNQRKGHSRRICAAKPSEWRCQRKDSPRQTDNNEKDRQFHLPRSGTRERKNRNAICNPQEIELGDTPNGATET